MNTFLAASLSILLLTSSAWSDEAGHRSATMELMGLMQMRVQIKSGFLANLDPVFERSQKSGNPAALTEELRAAMTEWISEEKRMSELESLMCDLYMKELGEDDINHAIALFKVPGGAKLLQRVQIIAIKSMAVNNKYFDAKQAEMQQVMLSVIAKHKPGAGKSN